jgi:hypothetical protein
MRSKLCAAALFGGIVRVRRHCPAGHHAKAAWRVDGNDRDSPTIQTVNGTPLADSSTQPMFCVGFLSSVLLFGVQ